MAYHKNYVEIIGNLGDNPKLITSTQGQPRFTCDICSSEPYKQGNEWKSTQTWFNCIAWGNLATKLSRINFEKGQCVFIEAKYRNNNWVNSQTGDNHREGQFQIIEMRKMAKPQRNKDGESSNNFNGQATESAFQNTTQEDDDDLPF